MQAGPREVSIATASGVPVYGDLMVPASAGGLVIFAHGSGSSRHSNRNRFVAELLQEHGLATFLIDLLTADEDFIDLRNAKMRFDIGLLASRLTDATNWVRHDDDVKRLPLGYFGASTGAAAALVAAAYQPERVRAIVSRGGRPDLAGDAIPKVQAPTLLIVGGNDTEVLGLNRAAADQMTAPWELEVVPGATHLFEEPGALRVVADRTGQWFRRHLVGQTDETESVRQGSA